MQNTLNPPPTFRGVFRADDDARAVYSEAAGIARVTPMAVAVPVDVSDLQTLVRWAASENVALVPRGSGSSMGGGAIGAGVIVDCSRWRLIGDVNEQTRTIRVGPGVTQAEVDRIARARGLRFPVDPSSSAFCSVGGMASTNAAGPHTMRFGAMRRWVRAIDCVFADGSRADVRRGAAPPEGVAALERFLKIAPKLIEGERRSPSRHAGVIKDSSGYGLADYAQSGDLVDVLVGSEGTLAFFTELELALVPIAHATSSVLGAFATLEDAVVAASRAREQGAVACEMLERTFLDVAASGGPRRVPAESEAALLAEVEAETPEKAAKAAQAIEQLFRDAGAITSRVALDEHTETELWELRHAASPILSRLDPNLKSMQFVEDTAVPPNNFPAYVRGVRDIMQRHDTRVVIFGHAGDAHVHVNPLVDVRRPDWRDRVDAILADVVHLVASLGGTLTGEHGDGRLRAPELSQVWPTDILERFREVKAAFDPAGILNPGVKLAKPAQQPIGDVKYDPAAAPLPPRARHALDEVERTRSYARFRLELLD